MTGLLLLVAITFGPPSAFSKEAPTSTWEQAELVPVLVPEASPRAIQYYRSGIAIWVGIQAWRLLIPAVILFSGFSGRIRDLARRIGHGWFGTIAVYAILYLVLMFIIDLPIDYYLGYVRPHSYGLSEQSIGRWLEHELKSLAVSIGAAVAVLWIPYWLLVRSPRRWWLYSGLLTLPLGFFVAMIMPIWIDPLFNTSAPMKDKTLEAKILALADRAGIDGGRVFEVDKSRDTKTVNAYVTGMFGTKRIVLWDTLLANHTEKEVLAVMGHEMGHYVLNHVAWVVLFSTFGSLAVLFLVDRAGRRLIGRFGRRFGFDRIGDVASVPLFIVLLTGINLIGAPLRLAVSRAVEHEADRFALEITRSNHSAGSAFARMQHENLSNPRPGRLSVLFRSSHPPLGERIDFSNRYHPWTEGIEGRYERLFREAPIKRLP